MKARGKSPHDHLKKISLKFTTRVINFATKMSRRSSKQENPEEEVFKKLEECRGTSSITDETMNFVHHEIEGEDSQSVASLNSNSTGTLTKDKDFQSVAGSEDTLVTAGGSDTKPPNEQNESQDEKEELKPSPLETEEPLKNNPFYSVFSLIINVIACTVALGLVSFFFITENLPTIRIPRFKFIDRLLALPSYVKSIHNDYIRNFYFEEPFITFEKRTPQNMNDVTT